MLRAGEDYLETVLQLEKAQNRAGVRITDIAKKLGVTKPSVIRAMKQLNADGYVEQESYGDIYLTEKGRMNSNGKNFYEDQAAASCQILHPRVQPLQDLRPSPRLPAQVRHLPYLLP